MVLVVCLGVVGLFFGAWLGESVQISAFGSIWSGELVVGLVFAIIGAQAGALLQPGQNRERRRSDRCAPSGR